MVGRERLTQMYQDWQNIKYRLEMAQQMLRNTELEATKAEARFRGAVEMLAGPDANWRFDVEKGILVTGQDESPAEAVVASAPPNGATTEVKTTDEHGNVNVTRLPTNNAKRKRVLRQLAKQQLVPMRIVNQPGP